ncbi:hypothetical protein [Flavilitoribacter nigricans]|uniref:Baseplate protein J-like domain-containing protein n=1 Tax=Flavilitoribacter nigricans (strain ATCC 23147 / DSM 23189 / NBRC 102662 / NCIMB 1420 / SS-2) TaxID=1122177 RepID=A0A2D0MWQ8_FLAN2|nr:hypothetical protein [Flavilitoribacter nigricans]PHN00637.1 hypothetical protein CRP01_41250 [Flavilitoribacter nigricans DSM 23189 = NBRC 102662]
MINIQDIYNLQIRTLDEVKNLMLESKERISEIYTDILDEVLADAELSGLSSTSKTAVWRLWAFVTAVQIWMHEFLWVKYKAFLDQAATYAQPHTLAWYQRKALEYQHGDTLIVDNGSVIYSPIDPDNRIIIACSVKETTQGIVVLKAAKDDGNGGLTALSEAEKDGFEGYVNRFKDAGVRTQIISQNADVLKLVADVYYSPGISPIDTFKPAFEAAINEFLLNLPFDGVIRKISLIDAMQNVLGFVDIGINEMAVSVAYDITPNFVNVNLSYETVSGFLQVDENFPLDTQINYIANV